MADLQTTTLLVGLVVALTEAVKWLAKSVVAVRSRNGNGKRTSGQLDPAEWEQRIGRIVKDEVEEITASRNEQIRAIFREELNSVRQELDRRRR